MRGLLGLLLLCSACALAQGPRAYFPWWESPITQQLDLTEEQRGSIRSISREHRDQMIDQRAAVEKAEAEMQDLFDEEQIDDARASQTIDRLVAARSDLTRSFTEMSLRLRKLLTLEQWGRLQREQRSMRDRFRQPARAPGARRPPQPPQPPRPQRAPRAEQPRR